MTAPEFTVRKMSYVMPYSAELVDEANHLGSALQDYLRNAMDPNAPKPTPPVDPGPNLAYLRLRDEVSDSPMLTELVELHAAEWIGYGETYRCTGDHSGDDYADWPCETVAIVATHRGVALS
jgi:hypothetical protein